MLYKIRIDHIIWACCLLAVITLSACSPNVDISGEQQTKTYLTLNRSTIAIADGEQLELEKVRILVFDASGNKVSNNLFPIANDDIAVFFDEQKRVYIIEFKNDMVVEARRGTNFIYLVLNENAFGSTVNLTNVPDKATMEKLRSEPIPYNTPIKVNDAQEPPFLMCTYAEVNITEASTYNNPQSIDMTGVNIDGRYAYSMRRTMAKVILQSVTGGQYSDNKGEVNSEMMIKTSAVHILKMELINVPNSFSWKDEYQGSYEKPAYTGGYLGPIDLGEGLSFNKENGYYERRWPGKIEISGEVEFSRTDVLGDLWKTEMNDASYGLNPIYPFELIELKGSIVTSDAKKDTLDRGNSGPYSLNSGNFVDFMRKEYVQDGNFIPGEYLPGELHATSLTITPAVWTLYLNNTAYYIPENITSTNRTMIRVTASIATPTARFTTEEINEIIKNAVANGDYVGEIIDGDGSMINPLSSKKEIEDFLLKRGHFVESTSESNKWGIRYSGIKRYFKGTTDVANKEGYYAKITPEGGGEEIITFDIPLNNDDGSHSNDLINDHNVYRGHEYRVNLFVTKENEASWTRNAAQSIQISGTVTAAPIRYE